MSRVIDELKAQILQLSPCDRDELVRTLIASMDEGPDGAPEEIAKAWDDEIARRVSDLEADRTRGIPAERVLAEIRAIVAGNGKG